MLTIYKSYSFIIHYTSTAWCHPTHLLNHRNGVKNDGTASIFTIFSFEHRIRAPFKLNWLSFVQSTNSYGAVFIEIPNESLFYNASLSAKCCKKFTFFTRKWVETLIRLLDGCGVSLVNQIRMTCSHYLWNWIGVYILLSPLRPFVWILLLVDDGYVLYSILMQLLVTSTPVLSIIVIIVISFSLSQNRCVSMQSHTRWTLWAWFSSQFLLIFRNKFESVHMILLWFDFFDMDQQSQRVAEAAAGERCPNSKCTRQSLLI